MSSSKNSGTSILIEEGSVAWAILKEKVELIALDTLEAVVTSGCFKWIVTVLSLTMLAGISLSIMAPSDIYPTTLYLFCKLEVVLTLAPPVKTFP